MNTRIYIILPYLHTFETFEIEGIKFKGWLEGGKKLENNIAKENKKDIYHLDKILRSFRMAENSGLQGFIYSIQEVSSQEDYFKLQKKLEIAINIIRYRIFDKDQRGHGSYPQTALYMFELTKEEWNAKAKKIGKSKEEFIWYRGSRDFSEEVNIHWPREHIYPQKHNLTFGTLQFPQNYMLTTSLELSNWKLRGYSETERLRIVRAIEYYNNSYADGVGIDDRGRILSLSAGFEALFSLPDEGIGRAFQSGIVTLLGDIPTLREWAGDFYNLRSKIVHGEEISRIARSKPTRKEVKKIASLYFKHREGEEEYINHLIVGQSVFRKCLEVILRERMEGYIHDIVELLEPEEIHIKRIIEKVHKLKDKKSLAEWYESDILKEFNELRTKDRSVKDPEKIVLVGKELLTLLKKYLQDNKAPLDKEIEETVDFKGKYIDLAMKYNALHEAFRPIYFGDKTKRGKVEELVLEGAAYTFISYASHIFFFFKGNTKSS